MNADDNSAETDVIKNKKNFTVAVRVKPEFNAPASSLISLSVRKVS
jgi:hypothetical protein